MTTMAHPRTRTHRHVRRLRTADGYREEAVQRVYTGGWLLGEVARAGRVWRASASAYAFTVDGQLARQVPVDLYRPADPDLWLPGEYYTKGLAIAALVEYLAECRAPALGYGPHPEVI